MGVFRHEVLRWFDSGKRKKLPKRNTKLCMGLAPKGWLGYTILEIESEGACRGESQPGLLKRQGRHLR